MPLIETGMAATLNDINAWPMAMTIIGIHESRDSSAALPPDLFLGAMLIRLSK